MFVEYAARRFFCKKCPIGMFFVESESPARLRGFSWDNISITIESEFIKALYQFHQFTFSEFPRKSDSQKKITFVELFYE